jgi:uncharacterized phiE125 gp8 family phage protein
MSLNLRTVQVPSAEPVTLAEARLQCKVDAYDASTSPASHPDDTLIEALITGAREQVENFCNVILTDAVYEYRCPAASGGIFLPRGPVSTVDWVKYLDVNEALQTLATTVWYLDDNPWQAVINLKKDQVWPAIYARDDAVRVRFSGGFISPNPIPKPLILAMKLMIGHWYRNRSESVIGTIVSEIPMGAKVLMMPHRRGMGV